MGALLTQIVRHRAVSSPLNDAEHRLHSLRNFRPIYFDTPMRSTWRSRITYGLMQRVCSRDLWLALALQLSDSVHREAQPCATDLVLSSTGKRLPHLNPDSFPWENSQGSRTTCEDSCGNAPAALGSLVDEGVAERQERWPGCKAGPTPSNC